MSRRTRSAVWPRTASSGSSDADVGVVCILLQIYYWIVLARLLLSWFPRPPEGLRPVYDILHTLTEPVLRIARPLIPPVRMGGMAMDLSPILVFVLLVIAQQIVCNLA